MAESLWGRRGGLLGEVGKEELAGQGREERGGKEVFKAVAQHVQRAQGPDGRARVSRKQRCLQWRVGCLARLCGDSKTQLRANSSNPEGEREPQEFFGFVLFLSWVVISVDNPSLGLIQKKECPGFLSSSL